jgi:hypothetical protein
MADAKARGRDFMERLGKELDNSNEEQRLTYTILEYHSPYDPTELEEAMEERRTSIKKDAMAAAGAATRAAKQARVAAEKLAGTWVGK